ncbi:MAG: tetratricopeptide repeat protein [Nannocystaceae bacterium]
MDRLALLRTVVAQKPTEPFPRYGLAMELRKLGRLGEANAAFAELMGLHPGYVPAYLMAGNTLIQSGDPEGARAVFDRGIAAATAAGDDHARSELLGARDGLP